MSARSKLGDSHGGLIPIHDYRDLTVWQKAVELTTVTYTLLHGFPPHERFGLCSQMQRAATSVASNIAEGNAHRHRGHYLHHLDIARGSLFELSTQLEIAQRLGYVSDLAAAPARTLIESVSRMLYRLTSMLRSAPALPVPSRVPKPPPSPRA